MKKTIKNPSPRLQRAVTQLICIIYGECRKRNIDPKAITIKFGPGKPVK